MVTGIGSINGVMFDSSRSRIVVMAYHAIVLAGTQGMRNHLKNRLHAGSSPVGAATLAWMAPP